MSDRTTPGVVLVLSENWTMTPPRDLRALVRMAQEAEEAGIDAVMLSEHVVLGPSAGARGRMQNLRDYAAPGNQAPDTPWPDSIVLASAIAAATTRLRIALAAIIAPLRHPLLLAKQLATLDLLSEGRLIVQPTVSWAEEEYAALGVPFARRGAILDEQLEAMQVAWRDAPSSFAGRWFSWDGVWCEPRPYRPGGPRMWFGGQTVHEALVRRIVRYGSGFHPFGAPSAEDLERLGSGLAEAGRSLRELEFVGGIRGRFAGADDVADLDEALESVPDELARGVTAICFKPSMFSDDVHEVPELCRRVVRRVEEAVVARER